jgi:hypothetical protein
MAQEQTLCYGCKKIFNNAKDQNKLTELFPFMNGLTNNQELITENMAH